MTNILLRKSNHNAFTKILTNKKTQIIRQSIRTIQSQMKCWDILSYPNVVRVFWTYLKWHINERAWKHKKRNTIRIWWKQWFKIMIVQRKHCQKIKFDKQSIKSWKKRKVKSILPISWLRKSHSSPHHDHSTKRKNRHCKWEENLFRHSGKNDKRI